MKFIRIISMLPAFKTLIAAAIFTAIYFFMYYDNGAALELQLQTLSSELNVEEAKKKDTEATIKKEDEMQASLASLARDLQVVKAKLPNDLRDTDMTSIINRAAISAGISITSLSRKVVVARTESKVPGSESVEEVTFELAIEGPFNQFVLFIEQLAKEENIVKVRDFSIERNIAAVAEPEVKFRGEVVGFKQAAVTK